MEMSIASRETVLRNGFIIRGIYMRCNSVFSTGGVLNRYILFFFRICACDKSIYPPRFFETTPYARDPIAKIPHVAI